MLPSFGGNFSVLDKDGAPTITADTEQTMTYLSRLHSFLNESNTCITILDTNKDSNLQRSIFIEGRALFLQATISYIPIYLRGMQDDFGVLPYPKWDDMRGLAVKLESSDNTFASEMAKNQKVIEAAAEKVYLAAQEAAES